MAIGRTNAPFSKGYNLTINSIPNALITLTNELGQIIASATVNEEGLILFMGLQAGMYIIQGIKDSKKVSKQIKIQEDTEIALYFGNVFGIWRYRASDISSVKSSTWTRRDDSANFTAVASIGAIPGHSDFDNYYPWKMIKREVINGNVMVKIPKFYYRRALEGQNKDIDVIQISDSPQTGFSIHPLFTSNGYEADCAYVAAYSTTNGDQSIANAIIKENEYSKTEFRTKAKAIGNGWRQFDFYMLSALQMLILVEYADNNVQDAIGKGLAFCNSSEALANHSTGEGDNIANLTGTVDSSGKSSVVYRGIEDLWGKISCWIDGLTHGADRKHYIQLNPDSYGTATNTNCKVLSYIMPHRSLDLDVEDGVKSSLIEVGYDSNYPYLLLPYLINVGTNKINAGYTDSVGGFNETGYSGTGYTDPAMFGYVSNGYGAGLFFFNAWRKGNRARSRIGSRLMYIPPQEEE